MKENLKLQLLKYIAEKPLQVEEKLPYEEQVPFPEAKRKHEERYEAKVRANMVDEKEEEAPPKKDAVKKLLTPELSKGDIVGLDKSSSQVITGKSIGKHVLPCSFRASSYYGFFMDTMV